MTLPYSGSISTLLDSCNLQISPPRSVLQTSKTPISITCSHPVVSTHHHNRLQGCNHSRLGSRCTAASLAAGRSTTCGDNASSMAARTGRLSRLTRYVAAFSANHVTALGFPWLARHGDGLPGGHDGCLHIWKALQQAAPPPFRFDSTPPHHPAPFPLTASPGALLPAPATFADRLPPLSS